MVSSSSYTRCVSAYDIPIPIIRLKPSKDGVSCIAPFHCPLDSVGMGVAAKILPYASFRWNMPNFDKQVRFTQNKLSRNTKTVQKLSLVGKSDVFERMSNSIANKRLVKTWQFPLRFNPLCKHRLAFLLFGELINHRSWLKCEAQ